MRVILPLVLPGLAASAVFGFINAWNEVLFAIMFINARELQTLPLGILNMSTEFMTRYSWMAAAGFAALVPLLLVFAFVQRHLTGGLTAGAVKG